jgi:hypothetical protein
MSYSTSARLVHKRQARTRRVQTFLIRENIDAALNQAAVHCCAARQRLASGDYGPARYLTRCADAYTRFAEGCLDDIRAKSPASNIVAFRPRGIASCAAVGTPTVSGGSLPKPDQYGIELALLREANAQIYSRPTPWRVKS